MSPHLRSSLRRVRVTEAALVRARIAEMVARDAYRRADANQRKAPNKGYAAAIRATLKASQAWDRTREGVDLADNQRREAWAEARRVLEVV